MKIKWTVEPKPTGRYRSFEERGWPSADYMPGEIACANISCKSEYIPRDVKTGNHSELTLRIADWSQGENGFKWVRATKKFATLKELKETLLKILKANPHLVPTKIKENGNG